MENVAQQANTTNTFHIYTFTNIFPDYIYTEKRNRICFNN